MKKLILEVESKTVTDVGYALRKAMEDLENGYSSGSLSNEDSTGYWKMTDAED